MRIDKYLKLTRIIKRRTISKSVIDIGQVKINNKVCKPSSNVNIDDIITLTFQSKEVTIQVLSISERTPYHELYYILSENSIQTSENE